MDKVAPYPVNPWNFLIVILGTMFSSLFTLIIYNTKTNIKQDKKLIAIKKDLEWIKKSFKK